MANRNMKRCLTSLAIRKMQITTMMRYCYTPTSMAIIKKRSFGKDVEELEPSYDNDGNVNWCGHFREQSGSFSND